MADVQLSTRSVSVKIAYEANPDTNAFTDAEKARLAGFYDAASNNVTVGDGAGQSLAGGVDDTFVGDLAGQENTTGNQNTFVGRLAGQLNVGGSLNTFVGYQAGQSNVSGIDGTFIGARAGTSNVDGDNNTFIGRVAGRDNVSGDSNVLVGEAAGAANNANNNTMVGAFAGDLNATGFNNAFFGNNSGGANVSGDGNVYVGQSAGELATGSDNTMVGYRAGRNATSGDGNIIIGAGVELENAADGQKLIIGGLIFGQLMAGHPGASIAPGNLGIGVRNATVRLHVDGAVRVGQYATGSLPNAAVAGAGAIAFDSTLGGAVVSNGSSWESLAGGDGGGGGATTLGALGDVTISGVADNEVLAYDAGTGGWINQTAAEAGLLQPGAVAAGAITPAPGALNLGGGTTGQVLTKQSNGSLALETLPTGSSAVTSVFGRTGAVVSQANDYAVAQINGLPAALDAKQDAVMSPVSVTGSRPLALTDAGRMLRANSASPLVLTVPANASVPFPQGAVISVIRWNAAVSFTASSPAVILKPADRTLVVRERYEVVTLWQENIDVWVAFGGLAST